MKKKKLGQFTKRQKWWEIVQVEVWFLTPLLTPASGLWAHSTQQKLTKFDFCVTSHQSDIVSSSLPPRASVTSIFSWLCHCICVHCLSVSACFSSVCSLTIATSRLTALLWSTANFNLWLCRRVLCSCKWSKIYWEDFDAIKLVYLVYFMCYEYYVTHYK